MYTRKISNIIEPDSYKSPMTRFLMGILKNLEFDNKEKVDRVRQNPLLVDFLGRGNIKVIEKGKRNIKLVIF